MLHFNFVDFSSTKVSVSHYEYGRAYMGRSFYSLKLTLYILLCLCIPYQHFPFQ